MKQEQKTYKFLLSSLCLGLCLSSCSSNSTTTSPEQGETTAQTIPEETEHSAETENTEELPITAEISGKVLQLTPELVLLQDETGELQGFSGEISGITLGGLVNLQYNPEDNSLISGEQTAQEPDLLGAFVSAFLLLDGDLSYYEPEFQLFFQFDQLTFLSEAEKEVLLSRLSAVAPEHVISELSTWEDLETTGQIVPGTTEPIFTPDQVINGKYYAFFSDEPTETSFSVSISNDGGEATQQVQVTLDPETGVYTGELMGIMAG